MPPAERKRARLRKKGDTQLLTFAVGVLVSVVMGAFNRGGRNDW